MGSVLRVNRGSGKLNGGVALGMAPGTSCGNVCVDD